MNPALLATSPIATPDVQAQHDDRGICIDRVGIRGLRYPILIETLGGSQTSIASWELTVELQKDRRGTHMSRFVETLEQWNSESMTGSRVLAMLAELRRRLNAPLASARCDLTLFVERRAPVSAPLRPARDRLPLRGYDVGSPRGSDAGRARSRHDTLPVQQGDQRVRSAQPTRLRRDQRRDRA